MEMIDKLEQRQALEPDMAMDGDLLMIWWALGDREKVFHYISNCFEKGLNSIFYYLEYPMMNGIKEYPEIKDLIEKNISYSK